METIRNEEVKEIVTKLWEEVKEYKPSKMEHNDIIQDRERESADLELTYQTVLLNLREKFPKIPEDLTNKSINIRYQWENWVYRNIYLYNDWIALPWKKSLAVNKIWKLWSSSAETEKENWFLVMESFSLSEFNQRIDDIIKNADKCEIKIEDLDRPRIPTNE